MSGSGEEEEKFGGELTAAQIAAFRSRGGRIGRLQKKPKDEDGEGRNRGEQPRRPASLPLPTELTKEPAGTAAIKPQPGIVRPTRPIKPLLAYGERSNVPQPQKPKSHNPQRPEPTPYGSALYVARLISGRNPEDDQPEELKKLQSAVSALSQDDQRSLVFQMVMEALEDERRIHGLFAVASTVRVSNREGGELYGMRHVAHATAAVVKSLRAGLTPEDLQELGLVEAKEGEKGPYIVPHIGWLTIGSAVRKLKDRGDLTPKQMAGLRELQAYLNEGAERDARRTRQNAWNQVRATALKKAAGASSPPAVPEAPPADNTIKVTGAPGGVTQE